MCIINIDNVHVHNKHKHPLTTSTRTGCLPPVLRGKTLLLQPFGKGTSGGAAQAEPLRRRGRRGLCHRPPRLARGSQRCRRYLGRALALPLALQAADTCKERRKRLSRGRVCPSRAAPPRSAHGRRAGRAKRIPRRQVLLIPKVSLATVRLTSMTKRQIPKEFHFPPWGAS